MLSRIKFEYMIAGQPWLQESVTNLLSQAGQQLRKEVLQQSQELLETELTKQYTQYLNSQTDVEPNFSDSQLMKVILEYIENVQQEQITSTNQSLQRHNTMIQDLERMLAQTTDKLLEKTNALQSKDREISFLKENRVQMKGSFKQREVEFKEQYQLAQIIIHGLKEQNKKLEQQKGELSQYCEGFQRELASVDLQQYSLNICSVALQMEELHQRSDMQNDFLGSISLINCWELEKQKMDLGLYQQCKNIFFLQEKLVARLKFCISKKGQFLRRVNRKVALLKKSLNRKKLAGRTLNRRESEDSIDKQYLATECMAQSIICEVHYKEQTCQTLQTMVSIDARQSQREVEYQRVCKSAQILQMTVDSLNSCVLVQKRKEQQSTLANVLLLKEVNQLTQAVQTYRQTTQMLQQENRGLISHNTVVNAKILEAEQTLERLTICNQQAQSELAKEREQFKGLQQNLTACLQSQKQQNLATNLSLRSRLNDVMEDKTQLESDYQVLEQQLYQLRKRLLVKEEQSFIKRHEKMSRLENSQLNQTVKMGTKDTRDFVTPNNKDERQFMSRVDNLNEIINYMVNYSKGYNFSGEVKVRRGSWIQNQNKDTIVRILQKDSVHRKLVNHRRVKILCKEDQGTNELVTTFQAIMACYFKE